MKRFFSCIPVIIITIILSLNSLYSQDVYLFSYFKGNGDDGLHMAYSYDGRHWTALKNDKSFLTPVVGSNLMRDPSIFLDRKGTFHMVWTTGWWDNGFGYASSKDLIHWSEQKYVQAMAHEPKTKNMWAPEIYYDEATDQYLICWSSWILDRYPATDSVGHTLNSDPKKPKMSHRIYAITTKDFETFSPTRLFYEPGFNVIDASITKFKNKYVMFCKDETLTPPQKNIRMAFSDKAEGPYGPASEPIYGKTFAEGPCPLFIGDSCFVYFDKYMDKKFGAIVSTDFKTWKDISDEISYPEGIRHGTAFRATRKILDVLLKEK
jgi:hypothetical protein